MAIKLEIYLKRTEQTLEGWMDANGVAKPEDLLPRCAFVGLSASTLDVALASEIFKKRKKATEPAKPVEPVVIVDVKPKKKKPGPADIDSNEPDPS